MNKNNLIKINLDTDIILKLDTQKKEITFYTNMSDEDAINVLFSTILIIARSSSSSSSNDNSLN